MHCLGKSVGEGKLAPEPSSRRIMLPFLLHQCLFSTLFYFIFFLVVLLLWSIVSQARAMLCPFLIIGSYGEEERETESSANSGGTVAEVIRGAAGDEL